MAGVSDGRGGRLAGGKGAAPEREEADRDDGSEPVHADRDREQAGQPGERGAEQSPPVGEAENRRRDEGAREPGPGPASQPQSSKKDLGRARARPIESAATAAPCRTAERMAMEPSRSMDGLSAVGRHLTPLDPQMPAIRPGRGFG